MIAAGVAAPPERPHPDQWGYQMCFPISIARPSSPRCAAAIVACMVGAVACRDLPDRPATHPAAAATAIEPADVVIVTREPISSGPPISGELRAAREATVRAEVAGSVANLAVKEGEMVRRGQVLCRIEAPSLRDSAASAQVSVRSADEALATARREQARTTALIAQGLLPRSDADAVQKAVADAQARLAEAQAKRSAATEQSGKSTVRAPLTGVVSTRAANDGDVVPAGAPLVTIVDPAVLELRASVPADALPVLKPGVPVEFRTSGDHDETVAGRIDRIAPVADPVTRQVQIYVTVPNPSRRLVAGLFAEGRIAAASGRGLVVPAASVEMTERGAWVSRVRAGRIERVPVDVGLRDERHARVELRLGVDEGDALLTGPTRTIPPGTPVEVRQDASAVAHR